MLWTLPALDFIPLSFVQEGAQYSCAAFDEQAGNSEISTQPAQEYLQSFVQTPGAMLTYDLIRIRRDCVHNRRVQSDHRVVGPHEPIWIEQHHSRRRCIDLSNGQLRLVDESGICAHSDGLFHGSPLVGHLFGFRAGDGKSSSTWRTIMRRATIHEAIGRFSPFQHHPRQACGGIPKKPSVLPLQFRCKAPVLNFNAGVLDSLHSPASDLWVGVEAAYDNATGLHLFDECSTSRGSANVVARLEGHIPGAFVQLFYIRCSH